MFLRTLCFTTSLACLFVSGIQAQPLFELDFSKTQGNVYMWFENRGWDLRADIEKMNARFEQARLVIEPVDDHSGVFFKDFRSGSKQLKGVKRLKIVWGVEQYPVGADWSGPIDKKRPVRDPIGVMVFFGDEEIDSGSFFVPNIPYFLGFFLGEKERPGKAYFGNYWQKGGRYFCIPCDGSTGKKFITVVRVDQLFKKTFGIDPPHISGIAIESDVSDTESRDGRHSKAFIELIQLLPE